MFSLLDSFMIIWVFLRDEIVAIIGVKSGFCCNKIWVKVWRKIDMGLMEFLSIYCWNFGCFRNLGTFGASGITWAVEVRFQ